MLTLPIVVFLTGALIMSEMCDRGYVTQKLLQLPDPKDRKPLNQRLRGYDADKVNRYWGALDETALRSEQCFLELDLVFPFLYGAALFTSLLMAWVTLGRPFHPLWITVPVVVTVLADLTENLIQLGQFGRYIEASEASLQIGWIQVASTATVLKLLFFVGTVLFLVGLVIGVIVHAVKSA